MASFFGIIGMMTCIYVLYELLASVGRSSDNRSSSILVTILSFLALVCIMFSFPIGWLVRWHDNVMEKIYRAVFLEERKPLDEINSRKEKRMEEEIRSLTAQLKEAQKRPSCSELFLNTHSQGYKEGYRDGQQDHAAGINLLDEFEE